MTLKSVVVAIATSWARIWYDFLELFTTDSRTCSCLSGVMDDFRPLLLLLILCSAFSLSKCCTILCIFKFIRAAQSDLDLLFWRVLNRRRTTAGDLLSHQI